MRTLALLPINGLANRLRVIASAIAWADRDPSRSVRVEWQPTGEVGAEWDELFEPITHPQIRLSPAGRHGPHGRRGDLARLFDRSLRARLTRKLFRAAGDRVGGVLIASAEQAVLRGDTLSLKTCQRLCEDARWDLFRPLPHVRARVDEVVAGFPTSAVGVHVRRADNVWSRRHSPLRLFIEAIAREIDRDPAAGFFLATDSEDVREALRHIFGADRVRTRAAVELARDSRAGLEDAVVDLWSLSRTRKILGSYWSSFSETAAEIGGVPLVPCREERGERPG